MAWGDLQVEKLVREGMLDVLDPARRAGGNHGQHRPAAGERGFQAAKQFRALLQNGQVGGEVGVEHVVKAQFVQGGGHLARDARTHGIAERLAQRRAHGGCGLHRHALLRVGQRLPHALQSVGFRQRAGADFQIEIEIRAQNALAQQPVLARLTNGVAQPLHGQRILRAHVDIAASGAAATRYLQREQAVRHGIPYLDLEQLPEPLHDALAPAHVTRLAQARADGMPAPAPGGKEK